MLLVKLYDRIGGYVILWTPSITIFLQVLRAGESSRNTAPALHLCVAQETALWSDRLSTEIFWKGGKLGVNKACPMQYVLLSLRSFVDTIMVLAPAVGGRRLSHAGSARCAEHLIVISVDVSV